MFDHLELTAQTTPPTPVTLAYEGLRLPTGVAVAVHAAAYAGSSAMDGATIIELVSRDPTVLGADPTAGGLPAFVLYGAGPGTTFVDVRIDGKLEGQMPATVTFDHDL